MSFETFAKRVNEQAKRLVESDGTLLKVDISKEDIREAYLMSFPEGTNNIYIERTEHDCSTCNNFIGNVGNMVLLHSDGTLETVWDIDINGLESKYVVVSSEMATLIKRTPLLTEFIVSEGRYGQDQTVQTREDEDGGTTIISWNHFDLTVPRKYISDSVGEVIGSFNSTRMVFERALNEISLSSIETVLDLINEKQLYRGDSVKSVVEDFKKNKLAYDSTTKKSEYTFSMCTKVRNPNIRNSSIGQLLTNISNGDDLTVAVNKYESMVAGPNYKRPTAVVTEAMAKKMLEFIEDEGLEPSIYRRHATIRDVNINDVIFADKTSSRVMKGSLSDVVLSGIGKSLDASTTDINIDDFIDKVIPTAKKIEVLLENKHIDNFVSITAPVNAGSKNLFQWDNNFAWSYNGNMTDTNITKRVKQAGGNVDGFCRASLSWENKDDLDISVELPDDAKIYYGNEYDYRTGGRLDVDMNVNSYDAVRGAVENIVWKDKEKLHSGTYKVYVHNYQKRETDNYGFQIELKMNEVVQQFSYNRTVKDGEFVFVCSFDYNRQNDEFILSSVGNGVSSSSSSSDVWGLSTNEWVNVSTMMLSPNYWGENVSGNRHYMFMLEDCKNPEKTRGFYNEYLRFDTKEHRKAFEYLGGKMMCEYDEEQLSGIGFSSTIRKDLTCKVTDVDGRIRTLKLKF